MNFKNRKKPINEVSLTKAFLKKIPKRLEDMLNTQVKKDRFKEALKEINNDCDDYNKWEMKHDPYSFKDQEEAEKIYKYQMPRYIRWARQYYNIFPIEEPVTETSPQGDREKKLSAYFGISWIADTIQEKYPNSPDTKNYHGGYDNEVDTFGHLRVEKGFADRIKKKVSNAFKIIEKDLEQKEEDEIKLKGNGGQINVREQTEENSETFRNINIQNFKGIFGNVQAENVQTGDHTSINKYDGPEKKKIRTIRSLLKIIVTIVTFLAALLTCLYYLGWLKL